MEHYSMSEHDSDRRLGLLRQVLRKDTEMTCDNLTKYGGFWGNRANVALMCLVRQMLTDAIQSERTSLDKAERLVSRYMETDLRIFTLTEESAVPCSKFPAVRQKMVDLAIQYAVPVLDKVYEGGRADLLPLADILRDALIQLGLPYVSGGDFAAILAV